MKRENNLDLMRIAAAVTVVLFHAANPLMRKAVVSTADLSPVDIVTFLGLTFLVKIAVILFIMASGALVLASPGLTDLDRHFRKTWHRLGIPTLIYSLIYLVCNYVRIKAGFVEAPSNLAFSLIKMAFKGETASHLWYLYLLIPLYLMAPFARKMMDMLGQRRTAAATWILVVWGWVSELTGGHFLTWDLGYAAESLGTFMLGYLIHERLKGQKRPGRGILCFGLAFLVMAVQMTATFVFRGNALIAPVFKPDPLNLFSILEAALVFAGILMTEVKRDYSRLSSFTYGVYLVHPLIGWLLADGLCVSGWSSLAKSDSAGPCLILGVITTVLSFTAMAIWKKLNRKERKA